MKIRINHLCLLALLSGLSTFIVTPKLAAQAVPTTTTLAVTSGGSSVTSIASGSVVTLTATVTSANGAVTQGRVNFCDASVTYCTDIHLLGTAQLTSAGTAVLKFVPGIGNHNYKAAFVGTPKGATIYTGSASSSVAVSVTGTYSTSTKITASGSNGNYKLKATVSGFVNAKNLSAPGGAVSFLDTTNNNSVLATAQLGAGIGVTFSNSSNPVTGNQPQSVTVADFNGDGILDLAVPAADGVDILLGNGDGTFNAAPTISLQGQYVHFATVGDFNGDGIPDLAIPVPDVDGSNPQIQIVLGNGDGTFTPLPIMSMPSEAYYFMTGDANGDGKTDLTVMSQLITSTSVSYSMTTLLGNGDGTFTASATTPLTPPAGSGCYYFNVFAQGDFNGDGIPDIAVVCEQRDDTLPGSVVILLGNGDGTFTPTSSNQAGINAFLVTAGDFNGDGILDLAVVNQLHDGLDGEQPSTITVLLGNGDGTFTPTPESPVTGYLSASVFVGDFNGDGIADLVTADAGSNTDSVLLGNGDGTFAAPVHPAGGIFPIFAAVGDFNGDGLPDLAIVDGNYGDSSGVIVLLTEQVQTATATASGVVIDTGARLGKGDAGSGIPADSGSHLVIASYGGETTLYNGSNSPTITISSTGINNGAAATPVFSLVTGIYTSVQSVKITDTTSGATIYYTTDGTTPTTSSPKYKYAIKVSSTETLQAIAVAPEYSQSAVGSATYTIEKQAATPKFSLAAKTYTSAQSVKITSTTPGAAIYYTTDGTTPTVSSTQYTSAITVSSTETLQAIAVATGYLPSAVASATYTITPPTANPSFSPLAGTYTSAQTVTINDATPGATIYYTTNGTTPTTSSTPYVNPITVSATETIKAIAVAAGLPPSKAVSAKYTIK